MREIILRSYNEDKKQFYYFIDGCYYSNPEKFTLISGKKISNKISERICKEFNWDNSEQFTGLTDKNGVKIFEGDELLYLGAKGEVYYDNDLAMFMCKFKTNRSAWSFDSMDDLIEVIGNIHDKN